MSKIKVPFGSRVFLTLGWMVENRYFDHFEPYNLLFDPWFAVLLQRLKIANTSCAIHVGNLIAPQKVVYGYFRPPVDHDSWARIRIGGYEPAGLPGLAFLGDGMKVLSAVLVHECMHYAQFQHYREQAREFPLGGKYPELEIAPERLHRRYASLLARGLVPQIVTRA
jgi:hypothetical protein